MSLHRLSLRADERRQRAIDERAIAGFLRGELALDEALRVDEATRAALRRQAHALYAAGRWRQCLDVLHGLAAVGDVDAFDPLLMAGAYGALGEAQAAERCAAAAGPMLARLGALLDRIEQGETE